MRRGGSGGADEGRVGKAFKEALRRCRSRAAAIGEAQTWRRDSFVLYRIIGNDLPPRHEDGQSLANLAFILAHEPKLAGCEKRWIVNRIVDPARRAAIEALLVRHGQDFITIPFDPERYRAIGWDLDGVPGEAAIRRGAVRDPRRIERILVRMYRHKNNYLMNNNGARNAALRDGRARRLAKGGRAKWILPWDGNCFVTAAGWRALRAGLAARPWAKVAVVPMARVADNADVLAPGFAPPAEEEPQLAFRRDASSLFDEAIPYGRRPKVELLVRLGVGGPWTGWHPDPWDLPFGTPSPESRRVVRAGWVARLGSGIVDGADGSRLTIRERGERRNRGIRQFLDGVDEAVLGRGFDPARPLTIDPARLAAQTGPEWRAARAALAAESALMQARGPFSPLQKTMVAPSGDPRDYFSVAPYFWPDPGAPDGLPYVWRDGERRPGTTLYEPGSEAYDRSALQRALTDPVIAVLAFLAHGDTQAAAHGARQVRAWFTDPATRMSPHLAYAQIRPGRHDGVGYGRGTIEATDLVFLLDAARLLEASGALSPRDAASLRDWCRAYRSWLAESPQGGRELAARNNHGTAYDLQMLALAAYLGDLRCLIDTVRRAQARLLEQLAPDGAQPQEEGRTLSMGYCCFNLQLWVTLAQAAERCGLALARVEAGDGRSLRAGLDRFLAMLAQGWPGRQIVPFDGERVRPLRHARARWYGQAADAPPPLAEPPFVFPQTVGIRPFWQLGGAYG